MKPERAGVLFTEAHVGAVAVVPIFHDDRHSQERVHAVKNARRLSGTGGAWHAEFVSFACEAPTVKPSRADVVVAARGGADVGLPEVSVERRYTRLAAGTARRTNSRARCGGETTTPI
jgi:hypothetical protein